MFVVADQSSPVEASPDACGLSTECAVFSRYLIGRLPPPAIIRRYARAHEYILCESADEVVAFAVRYPRVLPFLDAACGIRRPSGVLRRKLLVLTAILEATPEFADHFLSKPIGRVRFLAETSFYAAAALLKCAVGCLLLPLVRLRS